MSDIDWKHSALRLGEALFRLDRRPPDNYYSMTLIEWLSWALKTIWVERLKLNWKF